MKQTIQSIIAAISAITSVKYVDRDWGQLSLEQPPVKFPCALVDYSSIDFSQSSSPTLVADQATIAITIADQHLVRTSANAPAIQRLPSSLQPHPLAILDVVNQVITKLQCFTCQGHVQPLTLTNITKSYSDRSYDVYTLTFTTSFLIHQDPPSTTEVQHVTITI